MLRFIDRIGKTEGPVGRAFWIFLLIGFTAAFGFELAAYRYGHGDVAQIVFASAFALTSSLHLVEQHWLRVLLFFTSVPLLALAIIPLTDYTECYERVVGVTKAVSSAAAELVLIRPHARPFEKRSTAMVSLS